MQPSHNSGGPSLRFQHSTITSSRDTNIHVIQNHPPSKDAMEILKGHVAFGALFNSNERFDPPKCHPDTRKAVLDAIDRWARGIDDPSKPIMWLHGAMGAGKSAIAQTSAERWAKLKVLAASFFFSRTVIGRNETTRFIPTLAYQLTLSIPSTRPYIEHAILNDVGLFEKKLLYQMEELIIQPLEAAGLDAGLGPQVIVIDGLDECCQSIVGKDHESQQRELLQAITSYADQDNCPVRFLVASRPERQIRTSFSHTPLHILLRTVVLDDTQNPDADIELYLECRFGELRLHHPYLGSSWPPEGTVSTLLKKSSGHFIYAATATRYLERPRQDPRVALESILGINPSSKARDAPFAELDALYLFIMRSVLPESVPIVLDVFGLLCFRAGRFNLNLGLFGDYNGRAPTSFERFLFLPSGSLTYHHLVDLHSILQIPTADSSSYQARQAPLRFIHASFSEFLLDRSRSGSFCIEETKALSRFQSIRLRHVLIQSLQPDFGLQLGYQGSGLVAELVIDLDRHEISLPQDFAEGLAALVGEDKEAFARYIRGIGLDNFGVERNPEIFQLLSAVKGFLRNKDAIGTIMEILKRYGIEGVKPLSATQDQNSHLHHNESPSRSSDVGLHNRFSQVDLDSAGQEYGSEDEELEYLTADEDEGVLDFD